MIQLGLFDEVVDSKVCKGCKIGRPFSEYNKKKTGKFGLQPKCKGCFKQYREANSDKIKQYSKQWKEANKDKIKQYCEANSDKIKEKKKQYYEANKDKSRQQCKKYYEANKDKIKQYYEANRDRLKQQTKKYYEANKGYSNQRQRNRRVNDPLFKLTCNIRGSIYKSLKNKGYKKNTKTANYLGCDYDTLLTHLNDNKYGFIYDAGEYDVDHIIPLAIAKTESDIFDLNYYKNLQLLPSEFNRYIKRDRVMTLEEIDTELKEWLNKKP